MTYYFGIHYCESHYSLIKDSALRMYDDGERLKHGNMVYLERHLFMDVSSKLAKRIKKLNAELKESSVALASSLEKTEELLKAKHSRTEYQRPWYKRLFYPKTKHQDAFL